MHNFTFFFVLDLYIISPLLRPFKLAVAPPAPLSVTGHSCKFLYNNKSFAYKYESVNNNVPRCWVGGKYFFSEEYSCIFLSFILLNLEAERKTISIERRAKITMLMNDSPNYPQHYSESTEWNNERRMGCRCKGNHQDTRPRDLSALLIRNAI